MRVAYSRSPAKSPVKGRLVRFAPCRPGASPTINRRPSGSPNEGTGELNQSGSRSRAASRKLRSLGQSGQLRSGSVRSTAGNGRPLAAPVSIGWFSVLEFLVITPWHHRGRALQELRRVVTRLTWGRTFGRVPADLRLQLDQIGEHVRLSPQLIGDHRRLARDRRNHSNTNASALHGFNE